MNDPEDPTASLVTRIEAWVHQNPGDKVTIQHTDGGYLVDIQHTEGGGCGYYGDTLHESLNQLFAHENFDETSPPIPTNDELAMAIYTALNKNIVAMPYGSGRLAALSVIRHVLLPVQLLLRKCKMLIGERQKTWEVFETVFPFSKDLPQRTAEVALCQETIDDIDNYLGALTGPATITTKFQTAKEQLLEAQKRFVTIEKLNVPTEMKKLARSGKDEIANFLEGV